MSTTNRAGMSAEGQQDHRQDGRQEAGREVGRGSAEPSAEWSAEASAEGRPSTTTITTNCGSVGGKEVLVPSQNREADGSSTKASEAARGEMSRALLAHGVFVFARGKRDELGGRLADFGFTPSDLDAMAGYVLAYSSNNLDIAASRLAGLLQKPDDELQAAVDDWRAYRATEAVQAAQRPAKVPETHPGEIDRRRTSQRLAEERAEWKQHDRLAHARALAADGNGAEMIACYVGLPVEEAQVVVDAWRAARVPPRRAKQKRGGA